MLRCRLRVYIDGAASAAVVLLLVADASLASSRLTVGGELDSLTAPMLSAGDLLLTEALSVVGCSVGDALLEARAGPFADRRLPEMR